VNLVLVLFLLPESLPATRRRVFSWANANPLASFGILRRNRAILTLAASLFLYNLALHGMYTTWIFSTTLRFGWGIAQTGITFAVMGVLSAIAQGGLVGPAVKRLGERRSILVGLSVGTLAFLAYAVAPQSWMFYVVIAIASFAALEGPASQSMLASSVGEDEQGAMQGAMASVLSLTRIVGPLIATNAFAYFVSPSAPVYFPGAPFATGAVLIAGALALVWRFVRPVEKVGVKSEVEVVMVGGVAAEVAGD
jgi:MFS transporter, DHA1 family, tetracycline resistance protein